MRVGLNATCFDDRPSGAKQRFVGLYGALARSRPDIEFIVYEPADCRAAAWLGNSGNVTARPTSVRTGGSLRRALTGFGRWRAMLAADRLDIFETFNMPMIEAPVCPTILTIHDARHVHAGNNWLRHRINVAIWRRALARAALTVTVSDTMRTEILAFQPGVPVFTVYNGIDAAGFEPSRGSPTPPPTLPPGFILSVGHFEPRKNYVRLIAAVAEMRARADPVPLVIVGNDGGGRAEVEAAIVAHGLQDQVTLLSNVDDADLRAIYRAALLVVFPSSYEGFGIPVLEAMAAKRPLVTSDIAVFRELTEDRGVYFPHDDAVAMADAIQRVRADPSLARQLVDYGTGRIADFAFDKLAAEVSNLYETVLRRSA